MLRWGEIVVAVLVVLLAWAAAVIVPARAHDWYPAGCCKQLHEGGGDCGPADVVKQVPEGTVFRQRVTGIEVLVPIDFKRRYPNPVDNLYHVCVNRYPGETGDLGAPVLYCVFEPQGSYRHDSHDIQDPLPPWH